MYSRDDLSKPYALSLANKSFCDKQLKALTSLLIKSQQFPFYQDIYSIFVPFPVNNFVHCNPETTETKLIFWIYKPEKVRHLFID